MILLSLTVALTGERHRHANIKYFMNVTFYALNFLCYFLSMQSETLPFMDSGGTPSFIASCLTLNSRLLVTVIVNIMRIGLVARLDKPVLRRLFKSFPEEVVMRTSEWMKKGREVKKEYLGSELGAYECPRVICLFTFRYWHLILLCKK